MLWHFGILNRTQVGVKYSLKYLSYTFYWNIITRTALYNKKGGFTKFDLVELIFWRIFMFIKVFLYLMVNGTNTHTLQDLSLFTCFLRTYFENILLYLLKQFAWNVNYEMSYYSLVGKLCYRILMGQCLTRIFSLNS